jgi:hypothetical protein
VAVFAALALARSLAVLDETDDSLRTLVDIPHDRERRLNDGACDPHGRFWVGSMALDERPEGGAGCDSVGERHGCGTASRSRGREKEKRDTNEWVGRRSPVLPGHDWAVWEHREVVACVGKRRCGRLFKACWKKSYDSEQRLAPVCISPAIGITAPVARGILCKCGQIRRIWRRNAVLGVCISGAIRSGGLGLRSCDGFALEHASSTTEQHNAAGGCFFNRTCFSDVNFHTVSQLALDHSKHIIASRRLSRTIRIQT